VRREGSGPMDERSRQRALRVVIADDHPFYRAGLSRLLRRNGLDVAAEVFNGETAIQAAEETSPDVVIVDLNMPGTSGLEVARRLAERDPPVPVLMLSVSADEADVTDAILAGANGYVLKDRPAEEIIAAIRAAAAGQSPVSPRIAGMLVRRLREVSDPAEDDFRLGMRGHDSGLDCHAPPPRPATRMPRRW
jgi:DNA-binding NarL/FixJ family response regulator